MMAGLLGYALVGATKGFGAGLVEQANAAREAALEDLRNSRRQAERLQEREWQLGDRADERGYAEGQKVREREYQDGKVRKAANVYESLFGSESGGDFGAANSEGYTGRAQFGSDRLTDFSKAMGIGPIDINQFRRDPELQKRVEQWHFGDIDSFIDTNGLAKYEGQTIGGVPISRSGMIAMAHLGGKNGLKKFLESDGRYDPADSNGTNLSDYAAQHGGLPTDMTGVWDVISDPDTPAPIRDRILEEVDRRRGRERPQKLTGDYWLPDGKGNEVMNGRNDNGQIAPYANKDGTPVTRKAKEADLSPRMLDDIRAFVTDPLMKEVDYAKSVAVENEMRRLMRVEGLSEGEAFTKAKSSIQPRMVSDGETGGFWSKPKNRQDGWMFEDADAAALASPSDASAKDEPAGPPPAPEAILKMSSIELGLIDLDALDEAAKDAVARRFKELGF